MEIRALSRVLAWSREIFVPPLLGPGPSRHTQKHLLITPVPSDTVPGTWAEHRRAASCSYQTLSHFFPQHCSLHLWSPKLVCPDKRVCLACLPSFRPGSWLCGSGQALILNFPNFRSKVRPAAPPPAPPLPLTPQGCLICKSGSLCKFWGRGVRWAGLRTLVCIILVFTVRPAAPPPPLPIP